MSLDAPVHEGTPYWIIENGIAVPQFLEVLGTFQGLQRAVNAYAQNQKNLPAVLDVDGRIGPMTLTAVQEIASSLRAEPPKSVDHLAGQAERWGRVISEAAKVAYDPTPQAAAAGVPARSAAKTAIATRPRRWLWWSLAIGAVAGIGILAWVMYRKKQGRPVFAFSDAGGDVIDAEIVEDEDEDDEGPPMLPGVIDF